MPVPPPLPLSGHAGITLQIEHVRLQLDKMVEQIGVGQGSNAYFAGTEAQSALARAMYLIQKGEDVRDTTR